MQRMAIFCIPFYRRPPMIEKTGMYVLKLFLLRFE